MSSSQVSDTWRPFWPGRRFSGLIDTNCKVGNAVFGFSRFNGQWYCQDYPHVRDVPEKPESTAVCLRAPFSRLRARPCRVCTEVSHTARFSPFGGFPPPMDLNRGLEYCHPRFQPSPYMAVSVSRPPSMFAHPITHHYSDQASSSSFMIFSPTSIVAQQSVAYFSVPNIRTPFAAPTTRQNAYFRGLNVSFGDI